MNFDTKRDNPGAFVGAYDGLTAITKYGMIQHQTGDFELLKRNLERIEGPGMFVEIGVLGGQSLLQNYDLCHQKNIQIVGIDPFETIKVYNGCTAGQLNYNLEGNVYQRQLQNRLTLEKIISEHNLQIKLVVGTSWENHSVFEDNSIDLLHIDGDHSYEGVKKDITLFWPKIKHGGVVVFDDYNWVCVKKAVDEFVLENNIQIANTKIFNMFKFEIVKA